MGCKGREQSRVPPACNIKVQSAQRPAKLRLRTLPSPRQQTALTSPNQALTFFSVSDIITPRRKRVTWPELEETTRAIQSAATEMAAAAACRVPKPLGSV